MAVESSVIHVNSDDYYISAKHDVNSSVIAADSSNVILCQRIEDIYSSIMTALNCTAVYTIPTESCNFRKYWWNEEMNVLKQESISHRRAWVEAGET